MPYQKGPGKTVVIALGGNALGNTPQEQLGLVQNTAKHIVDMIEDGTNVVVSHGNGPQVGMINNAFAYASAHDGKTPDMPFPEAGAMSQGYIGYQLSQAILNDLKARDILRSTACIVTQTVVDADDPAFEDPTKPVGAFMDEETAKAKAAEMGITVKEDAGRGGGPGGAPPPPHPPPLLHPDRNEKRSNAAPLRPFDGDQPTFPEILSGAWQRTGHPGSGIGSFRRRHQRWSNPHLQRGCSGHRHRCSGSLHPFSSRFCRSGRLPEQRKTGC